MNTSMSVAGKLIKHVKQHPILYDSSDVDYRNNEKKDQLWEQIAEDLKENAMDVRKRWRNLRDTYVKLLKLVKGSEKDPVFEAAAIRKYHKWVWTKEMEFFRSHFTYGNQLNLDLSEIPRAPSPNQTQNQRTTRSSNDVHKKKPMKRELSSSPSPTPPKRHKHKKLLKSAKLQQKESINPKSESRPAMITGTAIKTSVNASIPGQKLTSTELDATDRLFLAHSQNIKQFTARRQALTKLKIAEVIMEQEILHQEDMELASISATTARIITNNFSQRDDSPQPFESVCGYASEDGEVENLYEAKNAAHVQNPMDFLSD